jgi:hypothetical protein
MTQTTIGWIVGLVLLFGCGDSGRNLPDVSAGPLRSRAAEPAASSGTPTRPAITEAADAQAVNYTGAATKQFLDRLSEYTEFQNGVEKTLPALRETASPEEIAAREKAMGAALIARRPNAKEGDFFITSYRPILTRLIREDFAKRAPADRKALIVELPKGVSVSVNQVYPTTLPLATFPANLLKILPELPPALEYRIVGRDLILRDVKGNVVVDVMRNVFPITS